ncbi:MAG TPA: hypothetical protein VFG04_15750 [Planctomycetaceae bacterium]|jgi:hypothetical protein|nr:hypothetical protein [Planctomycetaceae bacterium]
MSDEPKKRSWEWWQWTSLAPAIYLAGYFPVALVCRWSVRLGISSGDSPVEETLSTLYRPIFWLLDHMPIVDRALEGIFTALGVHGYH